MILVTLQTLAASWSLTNTFPYPWLKGSEIAILGMFAILFSWISFGFWTAVAGFWMLWRRVKEFTVADLCSEQEDFDMVEVSERSFGYFQGCRSEGYRSFSDPRFVPYTRARSK